MDKRASPIKFTFAILFLCQYMKTHTSLAATTITANQSLSGDQTIVSAGEVFELGFFKPGNRSHFYIGMWYYGQEMSVQTVVWVANREHPVTDRFSAVLTVWKGNLVLFNEAKSLVWSTNVSTTSLGSVQAALLDNGNLVLRAGSSSSSHLLWQSFDHPADTWLPGSKLGFDSVTKQTQMLTSWKNMEDPAPGLFSLQLQLDPNGSYSFIILFNRSKQRWTSGSWDELNHIFSFIPEMSPNNIYNYSLVKNQNESYFTYSVKNPRFMSQWRMYFSGQVWQLTLSEPFKQWNLVWSKPNVYAFCGAFATYNQKSLPFCTCLSGFKPKSQREWDIQDYSGGCSRTTLHCGDNGAEDQFIPMPSMPLSASQQFQRVGSVEDCKSICLNNCDCTAYVYGNTNGCYIWTGDVLADESERTLYIRVAASDSKNSRSHKRSHVIAIVSVIAGLLTIIFGYFLWKKNLRKKRKPPRKCNETISSYVGGENDAELPFFSLNSILAATDDFSQANKLGEGGFGPVFKGILPANQEVAVKMLSKKSGQGHQEFMNELKLIAKLQHTNLVRLLGCCIEEEERILIYEYMPNRSLDKFLFDPSEKIKLDWGRRFRIIEGIAQGLLYIHKYSRLKIIHRDLKASNVLLDGAMNPKISDFGMARIFDINQTEANTNRVVGTYGYMSPEYARYGHFSEKSDVFSFGVLLLEIISGKKNTALYRSEHSLTLAGWAWELWKEGRGMEVIDASIRGTCRSQEALRCIHVGFLCVQEAPTDRPVMSSVVHMLQADEGTRLRPSKEPAFSTHKNSSASGSSSKKSSTISVNSITISIPEGR